MKKVPPIFIKMALFAAIPFLLTNCQANPEHALSKKQFTEILTDIMIIQKMNIKDKEKAERIEDVLDTHHTTRDQFLQMKQLHADDPQFWMEVYRKIQKNIKERSYALNKKRHKRRVKKKHNLFKGSKVLPQ